MKDRIREVGFELLRPGQIIEEQKRCSLVFIPVGGLEYHGPHLPLGVDAINATIVAREVCKAINKGLVIPTLYWSTERERPPKVAEGLGFKPTDWIVGMDFPSTLWKSHYYQEHVFALVLASKIEMFINHGYKVIMIVNGHGAVNHMETIKRLSKYYSHVSDCAVEWGLALPDEITKKNLVGHADIYEISLMLYYQALLGKDELVDMGTLPVKGKPIKYQDYSIVDGLGFSPTPDPEQIVQTDPRNASEELGKKIFNDIVKKFIGMTNKVLQNKGL